MSIVTGLLVYLVLWWLIFFMVLPWGVQSQEESNEDVVPGTPESAPIKPMIWRKVAATSVIAALLWGVFYLAITLDWSGISNG
ncbi:hypothetical protein JCM17844_03430 [Iodidimonas gelatinilytica]|uniref:DUF1467 domain-containing protein n=1 Tax=Iodidimonas gelatinilytica TaxID=1236966 RepID=A0A5A7MLG2_9PROT|nr:DUF1467 family protein [Iodidimonas gelatinilytica]GEQ96706.1 hypothetical protein JCM17844_03430 [Iodidimonas gelatinilytica]GER01430.1 hypothetical protein JCM17845_20530 [Iodidimonas gelatinilytica]